MNGLKFGIPMNHYHLQNWTDFSHGHCFWHNYLLNGMSKMLYLQLSQAWIQMIFFRNKRGQANVEGVWGVCAGCGGGVLFILHYGLYFSHVVKHRLNRTKFILSLLPYDDPQSSRSYYCMGIWTACDGGYRFDISYGDFLYPFEIR